MDEGMIAILLVLNCCFIKQGQGIGVYGNVPYGRHPRPISPRLSAKSSYAALLQSYINQLQQLQPTVTYQVPATMPVMYQQPASYQQASYQPVVYQAPTQQQQYSYSYQQQPQQVYAPAPVVSYQPQPQQQPQPQHRVLQPTYQQPQRYPPPQQQQHKPQMMKKKGRKERYDDDDHHDDDDGYHDDDDDGYGKKRKKKVEKIYVPVKVKRKKKKKMKIVAIMPGFFVPGGTQIFGKFKSLKKCQTTCAATPTCFGGDFNPWLHKCYLHTNFTACEKLKAHKKLTHFKKVPCEVPEAPEGRITLGAQLFRGIEQKGIKSLSDCLKRCATAGTGIPVSVTDIADQLCFGIDYDFGSHKCFFHVDNNNNRICPDDGTTPLTPRDLVANGGVVNILLCPGP